MTRELRQTCRNVPSVSARRCNKELLLLDEEHTNPDSSLQHVLSHFVN